jgi:hypothetical protein
MQRAIYTHECNFDTYEYDLHTPEYDNDTFKCDLYM